MDDDDNARWEREFDHDGTLGPCGCTDYHLADCHLGGAWLAPSDPDDWYDDDPRGDWA